jgi:putative ABC transport system permease protein
MEPELIWIAFAAGILTSLAGAVLPARRAAKVDPLEALHLGAFQVNVEKRAVLRHGLTASLFVFAIIALTRGDAGQWSYAGFFAIIAGAALLVPAATFQLMRMVVPLLSVLPRAEGYFVAENLMRAPRRTSSAVTTLMLSVAMAITISGTAVSAMDLLTVLLEVTMNAPLFVASSSNIMARSIRFPAAMKAEIESIEGVEEAQAMRTLLIPFRNAMTMLQVTDTKRFAARTPGRKIVAGDAHEMLREASEGRGVIVSENLATLYRLHIRDKVQLPTPSGLVLALPVVGVVREFAGQEGSISIDQSVFHQYWKDDGVDYFRVFLKPGNAADVVKERIDQAIGPPRKAVVLRNQELKAYFTTLTQRWFDMAYVPVVLAVLVAVFGIVNTLIASITERRKEFAVIRAIGGLGHQIRTMVWLEALATGFIGTVAGLALGAITLLGQLQVTRRDVNGFNVDYRYPVHFALILVPVLLVSALAAGFIPGEFAVRSALLESIEYE